MPRLPDLARFAHETTELSAAVEEFALFRSKIGTGSPLDPPELKRLNQEFSKERSRLDARTDGLRLAVETAQGYVRKLEEAVSTRGRSSPDPSKDLVDLAEGMLGPVGALTVPLLSLPAEHELGKLASEFQRTREVARSLKGLARTFRTFHPVIVRVSHEIYEDLDEIRAFEHKVLEAQEAVQHRVHAKDLALAQELDRASERAIENLRAFQRARRLWLEASDDLDPPRDPKLWQDPSLGPEVRSLRAELSTPRRPEEKVLQHLKGNAPPSGSPQFWRALEAHWIAWNRDPGQEDLSAPRLDDAGARLLRSWEAPGSRLSRAARGDSPGISRAQARCLLGQGARIEVGARVVGRLAASLPQVRGRRILTEPELDALDAELSGKLKASKEKRSLIQDRLDKYQAAVREIRTKKEYLHGQVTKIQARLHRWKVHHGEMGHRLSRRGGDRGPAATPAGSPPPARLPPPARTIVEVPSTPSPARPSKRAQARPLGTATQVRLAPNPSPSKPAPKPEPSSKKKASESLDTGWSSSEDWDDW